MPELSASEIVATKLMGFKFEKNGINFTGKVYSLNGKDACISYDGRVLLDSSDQWPDLTDWNDIRKMENALSEKGLLRIYLRTLIRSDETDYLECLRQGLSLSASFIVLRATQEQRVAAALRTIQEAGL